MAESALVATPVRVGEQLPLDEWREIRERAIFEFCKWDVQCEDHSVLARFPLLMEPETERFLNEKAEALTREAFAAEEEILRRLDLLGMLGLPRAICREMEHAPISCSRRREVRVMRFDFHWTTDGWRISEVNADVPGGFIEAGAWNALFAAAQGGASAPTDTSDAYADAIRQTAREEGLVALVHATSYSDDRQVMVHLARRFAARGVRACLCSPSHLRWEDGRAQVYTSLASGKADAIVRFFPADWLPNLAAEDMWKPYFQDSETALSNPGSAIVLQTKRFPLVWDELRAQLCAWREFLPETRDVSSTRVALDESCVLKPVLGRVGEGVGIRGITPDAELKEILDAVRRYPQKWVVQERFQISPVETEEGSRYPCIGVFTIGGKAAGFYGRTSKSPIINRDAQDVAVLLCGDVVKERG